METTTWLRTLRAALFTALCVTLAASAHVLLSRSPLPLATLAVVAAGVFGAAFALAGRERRLAHIAALLVPLELAVDWVFTRSQDTCYGTSGGPVPGSLRSVGALCGDGSSVGTVIELPGGMVPAWLLLLAHVAVGLIAAWWLRQGEAAAFRLLRALAAVAVAPLRLVLSVPVTAPVPFPARRRRDERPSPTEAAVRRYVARRGPPCPAPAW
ncbi:hypothetical protein GCM10027168_46370 [Streptomyces capparidis]